MDTKYSAYNVVYDRHIRNKNLNITLYKPGKFSLIKIKGKKLE